MPLQTLGVNLVWRSASEGITVSVDMTVTLFNKEQFAENRSVRWEALHEIHINLVKGCATAQLWLAQPLTRSTL